MSIGATNGSCASEYRFTPKLLSPPVKHCAVVHKKAFEKSLDSIGGSDPSLSASIHMPEQPSQSAPAPQQIIRSGESVTGGPIHFIGKDVWVKLAGGDLPGSLTVMEDLLRHSMARPSMHILLRNGSTSLSKQA